MMIIAAMFFSLFAKPAKVVDVNALVSTVCVVDEADHEWTFYGDGYSVEEDVVLLMRKNDLDIIFDDEILSCNHKSIKVG